MKRIFAAILLLPLGFSNSAQAGYDTNLTGQITLIHAYSSGAILFRLSNQPTTRPSCTHDYFSIPRDAELNIVDRM